MPKSNYPFQNGGMAPINYELDLARHQTFPQRGGMAPFSSISNSSLLDMSARTQAEMTYLDKAIADSQTLAHQYGTPQFHSQAGGRRKHKHGRRCSHKRNRSQRGGCGELQAFDAPYTAGFPPSMTNPHPTLHGGRRKHKHGRRCSHRKQRNQRGGFTELQAFNAPYTTGLSDSVTGVNPQFHTESGANPLYHESRGAQG